MSDTQQHVEPDALTTTIGVKPCSFAEMTFIAAVMRASWVATLVPPNFMTLMRNDGLP